MLPQRYVFSSKSQPLTRCKDNTLCCCCYHKGTYFQANHNTLLYDPPFLQVVVATTKVRIFKQITTPTIITRRPNMLLLLPQRYVFSSKSQPIRFTRDSVRRCCCYHKGTYFQANHNDYDVIREYITVVVATTKVRIFKQITTDSLYKRFCPSLLLLPQRYVFSSKSQPINKMLNEVQLLLLPQRYVFSSKSQLASVLSVWSLSCCCYHKGTYFQANHNQWLQSVFVKWVVVATTKVRIFKQITTTAKDDTIYACCCCYHKDMIPGADK